MVLWKAKTSSSAVNKLSFSAACCRVKSRVHHSPSGVAFKKLYWKQRFLLFAVLGYRRSGLYPAEAQVVQQLAVKLVLPSSEDKQLVHRSRCQQDNSHLGEEITREVKIAKNL